MKEVKVDIGCGARSLVIQGVLSKTKSTKVQIQN